MIGDGIGSWTEPLPWVAVVVFFAGLLVFRVGGSLYDHESIPVTVCLYLLQVILLCLQVRQPRRRWWTLSAQILISYGPTILTHGDWLASGEFILAAAVLLGMRGKTRWVLFAAGCVPRE